MYLAFFFFWCKSRHFLFAVSGVLLTEFYFGGKITSTFFLCKTRMEKNLFSNNNRGDTKTTQQPPLLLAEVKHIAPTYNWGTSSTGKAMELWREGWFSYSSPAHGGNNVQHTHMKCSSSSQKKNAICHSACGKRYQNDCIVATATRYKAQPSDTTRNRSPRTNYILPMLHPKWRGANYKKPTNTRL